MGCAGAPDDLKTGHLTQTGLATSDDGATMVRGGYSYHRQRREAAADVGDVGFQDALVGRLEGWG